MEIQLHSVAQRIRELHRAIHRHRNFDNVYKNEVMKGNIVKKIDAVIDAYKKDHVDKPLYLIISKSEGDDLMEEIRDAQQLPDDHIITNYKGIRIERSVAVKDGKFFLTNELPETGA